MQLAVRGVRRSVRRRNPNRALIILDSKDWSEAKVFWDPCSAAGGVRANQQIGGDSPVEFLVERLQE